jgi:hypothetical protein
MLFFNPAAGGDWIRNAALEINREGLFFGGLVPPKKKAFSVPSVPVVNLFLEQTRFERKRAIKLPRMPVHAGYLGQQ